MADEQSGHEASEPQTERRDSQLNSLHERVVRMEADMDNHERRHEDLAQRLHAQDRRHEKRFDQLSERLSGIEKMQNRTYWLVVGGFSTLVALGGFIVWAIKIGNGVAAVVGAE